MKIIANNDILMRYVPNSIKPVSGETSLFDKISAHLQQAEDWILTTFMPEGTFNKIASYSEITPLKHHLCQVIVAEALCRAIPSLDLVLTPNGFGVVSTQTVAAASKQRVDRLIGSMRDVRDEAIQQMLVLLPEAHAWITSPFAEFFGATLFPNLDLVTLYGVNSSRWGKYLELRSSVISIEESLAEEFFSPELMASLRLELLKNEISPFRKRVIIAIRAEIVEVLKTSTINGTRMRDIVNFIRNNSSFFQEWHNSATAKLFSPPKFENTKSAKGYWF